MPDGTSWGPQGHVSCSRTLSGRFGGGGGNMLYIFYMVIKNTLFFNQGIREGSEGSPVILELQLGGHMGLEEGWASPGSSPPREGGVALAPMGAWQVLEARHWLSSLGGSSHLLHIPLSPKPPLPHSAFNPSSPSSTLLHRYPYWCHLLPPVCPSSLHRSILSLRCFGCSSPALPRSHGPLVQSWGSG